MARTVLITGASTGIGYELAKLFAADGSNLVLTARDANQLERVAAEVRGQFKITAMVIAKDLALAAGPAELFQELQQRGLSIDVLVNNAGFGAVGAFAHIDLQAQLDMIHVNITSLVHLSRLLLPGMIQRNTGGLLNVASTAAFLPGPHMAVYYASKAFVLSFSEALSEELRLTKVRVTALCPGPTRTRFQSRAGSKEAGPSQGGLLKVASAAAVAQAGYAGFMRGRRIVVPGWMNKLSVRLARLAPSWLGAKVAGAVNRSK